VVTLLFTERQVLSWNKAQPLILAWRVVSHPQKLDQVKCEFSQTQEESRNEGTRHSEEQIIAILKRGEAGLTTAELCRQHGITEQTYYRWKAKYGGMESGDAKKIK